jgi:hypothetical protein
MLSNPDIAPSASINRWIVSILTFHFDLVHVPGSFHSPDGLSRRKPQPGDKPEPDDDFDDWIDRLHGFMHIINSPSPKIFHQPPISIYIAESNETTFAQDIDKPPDNSHTDKTEDSMDYSNVPRSDAAQRDDERILKVRKWHDDLLRPPGLSDSQYNTFLRYCTEFFISADRLWRKDSRGEHKLVVPRARRLFIMTSAHDQVGHHGFFATNANIAVRYWWPYMGADISWYVRTCHLCQLRKTQNVVIPPVVAAPAPIFAKIYCDTMHLPKSGGFKYLVQGRCSLVHWPEFDILRTETAKTLADWLMRCFVWRWGTLSEIVTDNGPPWIKALEYLSK